MLGAQLKDERGSRSAADVAHAAGVPLDTLRKIEQGAIAAPGFFLIVRVAAVLGLALDDLAKVASKTKGAES